MNAEELRELREFIDYFERVNVINCVGTSEDELPSGADDWKDYWQKQSGRKMTACSHCGSTEDLVGGHVTTTDNIFNWEYIVPLCKKCNKIGARNEDMSNPERFDVFKLDLVRLKRIKH